MTQLCLEAGAFDLDTFSGGRRGSATEQVTTSGPSWSTVFTGVYANQHGIRANDDLIMGRLNASIPTLFNYIYHNVYSPYTASLYDWDGLENLMKATHQGAGPDDVFQKKVTDVPSAEQFSRELAALSTHVLNHRDPQLIFHYTVVVDAVGHDSGYSLDNQAYIDAIKRVAVLLEPVLQKIQAKLEQA